MEIAIIKYNAGNLYSVVHALNRLGLDPVITDDAELIQKADGVVFPGQGEAAITMQYLRKHKLDLLIRSLRQPVLGICVGMQLMCRHSEEGDTPCLNIFNAEVKKFRSERHEQKIPHMGWNTLTHLATPLFRNVAENSFVYFIHSYYVELNTCTIAQTDYIRPFSAAIHKDNFWATQFHPEKSGHVGETILRNFLNIVQKGNE